MPFKMITLGEKEIGRIAGNAGAHAGLMASDLTARWRDRLPEGQEVVDLMQVQICVRDDLRALRREIAEIEHEHLKELESDSAARRIRDAARPELREKLIRIQRLWDGAFGVGTSTKVFGDDVTVIPTDPFPLRRVARIAHERLMDPAMVLPPVPMEGVEIQPLALARSFEEPLERLDEVLDGLEETLPMTSASLERKVRTLDKLQRQAGIAARFLEALYHLAGHDVIAGRVRLSSRRRRNRPAPVDDPDSGPASPNDANPDGDNTNGGNTTDDNTNDGGVNDDANPADADREPGGTQPAAAPKAPGGEEDGEDLALPFETNDDPQAGRVNPSPPATG